MFFKPLYVDIRLHLVLLFSAGAGLSFETTLTATCIGRSCGFFQQK